VRTIRTLGSSTPTRTPLTRQPSHNSKPKALWRRIAGIDRCNISDNVLAQDHRAIKRRVRASQHFRSFWGAWRTIAGYEAVHMIRKDQACWSAVGATVGLLRRFIVGMFGVEV
jgi:transposase-like protein